MSRQVDFLGYNLNVLVTCSSKPVEAWKTFATYYSFCLNAPDAKLTFAIRRPSDPGDRGVLPWAQHLGLCCFFYGEGLDPVEISKKRNYVETPLLILPAGAMLLSELPQEILEIEGELDGESLCCEAKSTEEVRPILRVEGGCGGFVMEKWIDNGGHPFRRIGVYQRGEMTMNEIRVLSFWQKLSPVYDAIG